MGIGAMSLYTPIALNLYKNKNADGFSTATWIYNIIGMGIACIYPYKKGARILTLAYSLTRLLAHSLRICHLDVYRAHRISGPKCGYFGINFILSK